MPAQTPHQADTIGATLPDYEVSRELGRGAMGVVYLGRHRRLQRDVAIKELSGPLADDAEVRSRFLVEARTLAVLDHPHVVPVYDYVEDGARCLLIMEALPGGTIWDEFSSSGLALPRACALALATCSALQHAHDHGILHRDIKPENLLFAANGELKVTDFGIAKVLDGGRTLATMDGSVLGTPAYMAPEQAEGADVGPTADVYAVATMLFEFASGRLPFDGDSPMALLVGRITGDAPPLRDLAPSVPEAIAEVIMAGLVRDPAARPATAEAYGCALGEAATVAWGDDWLERSGVPVAGSPPILAAAAPGRTLPPAGRRPGVETVAPGSDQLAPSPDRTESAGDTLGPSGNGAAPPNMAPQGVGRPGNETVAPRDPAQGDRSPNPVAPPEPDAKDMPPAPQNAEAGSPADRVATPVEAKKQAAPAAATVAPKGSAAGPMGAVRPVGGPHQAGFDAAGIGRDQLVGIEDVIGEQVPIWRSLIVTVVALIAAVALALTGPTPLDGPAPGSDAPKIANAQTAENGTLTMDLAEPLTIDAAATEGAAIAEVQVALSGMGIGTHEAPITDGKANVDLGFTGWMVTGPVELTITSKDGGGSELATQAYAVRNDREPWRSAQVPLLGVLALFGLGSIEAQTRRHRRGRVRNGAILGAALAGALLGATASSLWAIRVAEPIGLGSIGAVAVASAVAAGALTILRARRARRRRLLLRAGR